MAIAFALDDFISNDCIVLSVDCDTNIACFDTCPVKTELKRKITKNIKKVLYLIGTYWKRYPAQQNSPKLNYTIKFAHSLLIDLC